MRILSLISWTVSLNSRESHACLGMLPILLSNGNTFVYSGSNKDGKYACELPLRGDIDKANVETKFVVKARAIKVWITVFVAVFVCSNFLWLHGLQAYAPFPLSI